MVDVIFQQQVQLRQQRQAVEEQRRRLMSQQSLRQVQDRNVALQRQQQLQRLSQTEQQISSQDLQLQQLQQQQQSQASQDRESVRQQALKTLVEKGKGSSALYSLPKEERAAIEAYASELKRQKQKQAGMSAVSLAESGLSSSLIPELRRDIFSTAAESATTKIPASQILLPNLSSRFQQLTQPQFTPASQGTANIYPKSQDKYFFTPAPLSVTDPSKFRRQQISNLLQTPERSFQRLKEELGRKAEIYAESTRGKGYVTLGSQGVLPYTPVSKPTPEQVRKQVQTTADIGSFFVPILSQARLTSVGLSATGKIVEGDPQGIKEGGILLGTSLFIKGVSGLKSAPREVVTSSKFISQKQSGKAIDVKMFAKELSELTNAPVAIRTQSRIQSGVVQLKTQSGQTAKYTYKLSEESLGGGINEFTGGRLIRGFIKDSEGNIVSNINAISSESGKDLVSRILTTSITDFPKQTLLGKTKREVQTIAEQVVSVETKAPKGIAFILNKPKGIDIVQTPKKTFIDIGQKPLKVKYFEDVGIAISKPVREVEQKALIKIKPQKFIRDRLESKFDEGVFNEIFKQRNVEKAIAKTTRQTVQEPIRILEGFDDGVIRRTSIEREFGKTKTSIIPPKPKIQRKGVSMDIFLAQYYKNVKKLEKERLIQSGDKLVLATGLKLDQLKNVKFSGEGTTALLVRGALPKTIKIAPSQFERGTSRITSGAMFQGVNLFPEQTGQTKFFDDMEILARPPRSPDITFTNLGLVQKPIVKPLQIQMQRQQQLQINQQIQRQFPQTANIPKISPKIINLLRSGQLKQQQQQLRQLQKQRQLQTQSTRLSPKPRIRLQSIRIPLPDFGEGGKGRVSSEDSLGVGIEVRRGGRFTLVGKESTLGKALMKASGTVDVSLARSFRLRSLDTGELLDVSSLPIGFRRAKRESKTFVEESSRALSQFGEKKDIQYFKRQKRRRSLL